MLVRVVCLNLVVSVLPAAVLASAETVCNTVLHACWHLSANGRAIVPFS